MNEPTQTILIWPGVGVGVITAMVYGWRVLPALYLAEFSIALLLFSHSNETYSSHEFWISNAFIAVSLFRCYIGAFLFKYFIGYPNALITYQSILKFSLLVTPLISFFSSTAFEITRILLGFTHTFRFNDRFFDWWFGDFIGLLIFAPITLVFIAQPKSIWKPRLTTVAIPVILILFSAIFIYNKTHSIDKQRMLEDLHVKNEIIETKLNQYNKWIDDFINGSLVHFLPNSYNTAQLNSYFNSLIEEKNNNFNAIIWINESERKDFISSKIEDKNFLKKLNEFNFNNLLENKNADNEKLSTTHYNKQLNQFINIFKFKKENQTTYVITLHNIKDHLISLLKNYGMLHIKASLKLNNTENIILLDSQEKLPDNQITLESNLKFLNENWTLYLYPTNKYLIKYQTGINSIITKLSILFAGLIGIMLLIITGKSTLTDIKIKERTLELDFQSKELKSSKIQYQNLVEQHPVVLWRLNVLTNKMSYISSKVQNLYGYPLNDWLTVENFWKNQIHIDDQEKVRMIIERSLKDNKPFELEYRFIKSNGSIAWINDVININKDKDLNPQLVGLMIDITETREAKEKQTISESKYRTLFKHAVDPLVIINLDDNSIKDSNDKAIALFGLNNISGNVSLADFSPIKQPDGSISRKKLTKTYRELIQKKNIKFEWYMLNSKHHEIICKIELILLPEKNLNIMLANINDITEKKLHEKKINQLAYYDNLTKLPNREYFYSKFEYFHQRAKEQQSYGTLIFLDLDRFKLLNDSLGHQTGDELLKMVATRIRSVTKKNDFCARLGGDEFIIMTKKFGKSIESTLESSLVKSELILEALNEPYQLGNYEHFITPSIGISLFPSGDTTLDQIIHQADIAMYASKEKGKNTITIYRDQMVKKVGERLIIEKAIRQAFDNNEFQLYYQPQINIDNEIFSVEALLRWDRSNELNIDTEKLIATVEQIGLTHELGYWVFDKACAQLEQWQIQGHAIKSVAINVSAKQFHQPLFTEQIKSVIQSYNINPSQIVLELTEAIIIEDMVALISKLDELKEYGIRTSLDDFGTGYSSLAYLKHLPIDQLKIDKMFIHDLSFDESSQHIVKTIIELAKSMGIELIAEGIEIQSQFQILKNLGCVNFQGFYFSKAIRAHGIFKNHS
jgi:diguanylate cyclase (GGDEF)-like protein/PAS domain S-box-containing protein